MSKVALAVDGSEHSTRAFNYYLSEIHRDGNELILLHATEYPYVPDLSYTSTDTVQEVFDEAKANATQFIKRFTDVCDEKNINYSVISGVAKPGEHIVKTATAEKCTMIVMGTRGMGKIRRTVLGSVSDYVVHHAHCPVLIARQ